MALAVSLSLNMLILGAIGAMVWMRHGAEPFFFSDMKLAGEARKGGPVAGKNGKKMRAHLALARPGLVMASVRKFLHRLPKERRRALRRHMRKHRREVVQAFRRLARARAALMHALKRENFDPAGLDAALRAMREAEAQAREAVLRMLRELVVAMTPQERRMFAQIMRKDAQRRFIQRH